MASQRCGKRCTHEVFSICVVSVAAANRASRNCSGNSRPRFSARRRIPRQAFALKKYFGGTSPVCKTSDNEQTTASLGDAEPLSVKNAVGEPIPQLCQRSEHKSH